MPELLPNIPEAATGKYVHAVVVYGSKQTVQVGSVAHPMIEAHYIQWICLVTSKGIQRVNLSSTDKPEAVFYIGEEKPVAVYEYCNLHGLWKKEL
jgi:superoxide reductase